MELPEQLHAGTREVGVRLQHPYSSQGGGAAGLLYRDAVLDKFDQARYSRGPLHKVMTRSKDQKMDYLGYMSVGVVSARTSAFEILRVWRGAAELWGSILMF